jgi:hypothetical protein
MNKRGVSTEIIIMIAFLVLAVLVVLLLVNKARTIVGEEEYADAYAKNIALTVNSMLFSDYYPEVKFSIPDDFKVEILDDRVLVKINDIEKEHRFIPDKEYTINMKREKNNLILTKVKNGKL